MTEVAERGPVIIAGSWGGKYGGGEPGGIEAGERSNWFGQVWENEVAWATGRVEKVLETRSARFGKGNSTGCEFAGKGREEAGGWLFSFAFAAGLSRKGSNGEGARSR